MDLPGSSDSKASAYNVGDPGSIPGSGRSPGDEIATHSSTLAWKIPRMEKPGRLQPMGLQRVGHDWVISLHYVWMWELDHKEAWVLKNWWFWTVVLEKTLESSLGCKDIKLVNTKGNQPWIFIGRMDAEAAAPIFWPLDVKSQFFGKDPDAGKDWG